MIFGFPRLSNTNKSNLLFRPLITIFLSIAIKLIGYFFTIFKYFQNCCLTSSSGVDNIHFFLSSSNKYSLELTTLVFSENELFIFYKFKELNFKEIIKSIENRTFLPIYFLNGENTYFIDKITDKILDTVLQESEKDFNQTILYGKDTSIDSILDISKRYPVMTSHQLVIVKEAQHLSRSLSQLEQYFKNPVPTTILVLCFKGKKIDKRKSVGKILSKSNFLFDLELVKDYQLPDWIQNCAKINNLAIDSKQLFYFLSF